MWFRTDNGARNLENGHTLGVRQVSDTRSQVTWEIFSTIPVPGVGATTLQDGYATKEAAEEALEGFLSAHGIEVVAIDDPNAEVPAEGTEGPNDEVTESDKTGEPEVDEFASAPTTTRRGRNR